MVKTEEAEAARAVDEGPEVPAIDINGARVTAEVHDDILVVRVFLGKTGMLATVVVDGQPTPVGMVQAEPRGRHHRPEALDSSQVAELEWRD